MIDDSIEQRSLDWYRSRIGYITGSRVADIMKSGRKKDELWSETAKDYIYDVAADRIINPDILNNDELFQEYVDGMTYSSKAIQWGIDHEDDAKALYMKLNMPDGELAELGSCKHDTIPFFSASPDGAVYGRDGGDIRILEVKCPAKKTYMKYRLLIHDAESLKETEPKYYWQMMAEMCCTGAQGGVFITYHPHLSKPIHWAKIKRNDEDIKLMEERVSLANQFIDEIINK